MNKEALFKRFTQIQADPWEFLKCVRTLDQVDRKNPIKPFPVHFEYLELYVRVWERERLLAVPKSRRMRMSWTNVALYLWDAMFNVGRNHAFVSKKEDDSDELVKRADFIYENLDPIKLPRELLPAKICKYCELSFRDINSRIGGYPSGSDQLRQHTFSGILGDEVAFWPNAAEMYASSFPTIEGGGRMTLVSSAAPGFFKNLVFDRFGNVIK